MPKELKDQVRERLDQAALELYGVEHFTDMIADEIHLHRGPGSSCSIGLSRWATPCWAWSPFDM